MIKVKVRSHTSQECKYKLRYKGLFYVYISVLGKWLSCVMPFTEERSIFVRNTVGYIHIRRIYVKCIYKGEGYERKNLTRFFFFMLHQLACIVYTYFVKNLEYNLFYRYPKHYFSEVVQFDKCFIYYLNGSTWDVGYFYLFLITSSCVGDCGNIKYMYILLQV